MVNSILIKPYSNQIDSIFIANALHVLEENTCSNT